MSLKRKNNRQDKNLKKKIKTLTEEIEKHKEACKQQLIEIDLLKEEIENYKKTCQQQLTEIDLKKKSISDVDEEWRKIYQQRLVENKSLNERVIKNKFEIDKLKNQIKEKDKLVELLKYPDKIKLKILNYNTLKKHGDNFY